MDAEDATDVMMAESEDDATARKKAKKRTLTTEIVKKLCENAEGGESLAGAKALFQAYRAEPGNRGRGSECREPDTLSRNC